jgi:hypothetical protein
MATLTETTRVLDWLRATINPLASNRVYRDIAPDGVTTPFVIVGLMSGQRRGRRGGHPALARRPVHGQGRRQAQ